MRTGQSNGSTSKTQVVVLTADAGFGDQARATFGASDQIELKVVPGSLAASEDQLDLEGATVVVIDLDAAKSDDMRAPGRRSSSSPRPLMRQSRARWYRCASPISW